jgi:hypothetical protein
VKTGGFLLCAGMSRQQDTSRQTAAGTCSDGSFALSSRPLVRGDKR